ncbi:MAG: TlpA disulfide reductase family protein [Ilumatobacteraceae bacterium]|nr:TlpA disulfide reductase family protein [Ilumatobacteraceae bacterium]
MTDSETSDLAADVGAGDPPTRRGRVAPLVVGAVAIVVVGLFVILVGADSSSGQSARSPLLGNPAPAVSGEYADGTTFELSRRKGSWVVLNFFTHNCVPCIREHSELIEFVEQQRSLGVDGAEFYSIVRDSTQDEVDEFFEQRGGDWPIVYDTDFEFVNRFGVALVPETWIIDPNGFVRRRFISEVEAEPLSQVLQALREGAA